MFCVRPFSTPHGNMFLCQKIIFTQNWKSLSELVRGKQHTEYTEFCFAWSAKREIHKTILYATKTSSWCYIPFLFAIRQWELSGKYFSRGLRKVRKDYVAHLPFIHKWFRRNIHCFARMLPSGRQSTSVSVCASAYSPYKTSSILHSFCELLSPHKFGQRPLVLRCLREEK